MTNPYYPTLWSHLETLAGQFGPRPVGSPGNLAAIQYIASTFSGCGLAVERQDASFPEWIPGEIRLEVDGEALEAIANPYSPPCDLTAPLAACGTLAELRAADLRGKIVVAHGALARNELTPSYAVYAFGPDETAEALQAAQPAAVIMAHTRRSGAQPLIEDWTFPIPSVTVPARLGLRLAQRAGQTAHLRITGSSRPASFANVVARLPGARPERIVLCAHLDTKHGTPGAVDNASGVSILLALAQEFAGKQLSAGLEFTAFNGEDSTGGSEIYAYMEHDPRLEQILALINLDGIGPRLGATSYAVMSASPEMESAVGELAAGFPGLVKVEPWLESDHSYFTFRGVPGVPISTAGMPDVYHTPDDTLAWMDPARLEEAARFTAELVEILLAAQFNTRLA
jgi:aminopeptidase YwaD